MNIQKIISVLKNKLSKKELHIFITIWETGYIDTLIYGEKGENGLIHKDCKNYPEDYDNNHSQ